MEKKDAIEGVQSVYAPHSGRGGLEKNILCDFFNPLFSLILVSNWSAVHDCSAQCRGEQRGRRWRGGGDKRELP